MAWCALILRPAPADWAKDPAANTKRIAQTFPKPAIIAEDHGERLAAEGEICWGGMHSWKRMLELLEMVNRPKTLGFQADMAHTLLYTLGYNAPEDRILPENFDWSQQDVLMEALRKLTHALTALDYRFSCGAERRNRKRLGLARQNRPSLLAGDPNGKMDILAVAGLWMRNENGEPTRAYEHICWDGCMFPNQTMMSPNTWNDILGP